MQNMAKKDVQFCPRCGSKNIQLSKTSNLGDPLKIQGLVGWDCLDCGYTGKNFLIASKEDYEKILKKRFSNH